MTATPQKASTGKGRPVIPIQELSKNKAYMASFLNIATHNAYLILK